MIRLFKVKEQQRELAEANGGKHVNKQTAGQLRFNKDITELNLPKSCSIMFPNGKDDLMNFEVSIIPNEGYYRGGKFMFSFQVSAIYPHEAPKVKCMTKVYHPNIDLEGNVCLNVLREDWKPVLNINTIIYGLYHLFTEPNHEDPLNHDAAEVLRDNPKEFANNVRRAMSGGLGIGMRSSPKKISMSLQARENTSPRRVAETPEECAPGAPRTRPSPPSILKKSKVRVKWTAEMDGCAAYPGALNTLSWISSIEQGSWKEEEEVCSPLKADSIQKHRPLTPFRVVRGVLCLVVFLSTAFTILVCFAPVVAVLLRLFSLHYSRKATSFLFGRWLALWPFLFEKINGTKVVFSGDTVPPRERILIIANHKTEVDWMYLWDLALRKGSLGYVKYVLKSSLMKLPVFGWGFHILEFIPLKRKWEVDEPILRKMLLSFADPRDPLWLSIFPEGTDYDEEKCKKSQTFAAENGLPVLSHVLLPRTKGFCACLEALRHSFDAVYDLTIAYKNQLPSFMDNAFGVDPSEVHIHVRRIPMEEIPESSTDAASWLVDTFHIKDNMLSDFQTQGHFPNEGGEEDISAFKGLLRFATDGLVCWPHSTPATTRIRLRQTYVVYATIFTLQNHCPYTVWPGTLSGNGAAVLGEGGFAMFPGAEIQLWQLTAPAGWSGRFWARTGCNFDEAGNGKCLTGDCGGALKCTGGGEPPVTLAEFTVGSTLTDKDFYDVSLVDGYNDGMGLRATGGEGDCQYAGCLSDLNTNCPPELRVTDSGSGVVVACKSACEAFNAPEFCCTGDHATPQTCSPTQYSAMFKSACPTAYSYAYDDATSTCTCTGSDYLITFCPTGSS
ncbi:hypothetical protein ACLB2K_015345 [Fragaria x ananassa]